MSDLEMWLVRPGSARPDIVLVFAVDDHEKKTGTLTITGLSTDGLSEWLSVDEYEWTPERGIVLDRNYWPWVAARLARLNRMARRWRFEVVNDPWDVDEDTPEGIKD